MTSPPWSDADEVRLDVIVPVHDQPHVVRPCLESLLRFSDPGLDRVTLVADACDARTRDLLAQWTSRYGAARVLESERNLGFVRSCNRGLDVSTGQIVVLLNSDTCVTPRWADKLVACLESDPRIGVASPLTNFAPHLNIPMLPGADYFQMNAWLEQVWNGSYPDVTTPEGFCFAIRRDCLAEVGPLDLAYDEGYGEESDFALRANYLGFRTVCATNTYIFHQGRASYGLERREELYRASRRVFNARWRYKYPLEVEEFRRRDPIGSLRRRLAAATGRRGQAAFKRRGAGVPENPPGEPAPSVVRELRDAAADARAADRLRLLIVLPTLNPYGGVVSVADHVNHMVDAGHQVTVFSLSRIPSDVLFLKTEPVFLPPDVEVLELAPGPADAIIATSWETVSSVRRAADRRPDLVALYYVQDIEADFYTDGNDGRRAAAFATYDALPNRMVKTEHLRRRLAQLGHDAHLIPPGLELDLFYPRQRRDHERPTVLGMTRPGAPSDIRGFDVLREVYALLACEAPEVQRLVFGCDQLPSDIPIDVNFGKMGREALPKVYSAADVFVETSRLHGFGRCGVEAMACGAACVLSESGGISEYARDGENALIVPTGDARATAAAVLRLVRDADLRSRLADEGRESVQRFSGRRATDAILDLVRRLQRAGSVSDAAHPVAATSAASAGSAPG